MTCSFAVVRGITLRTGNVADLMAAQVEEISRSEACARLISPYARLW
ncbi:MAG: hypothetical protein ACLR5S_07205 [Ruminococcus sp.]